MSDMAEKLETTHTTTGPARCNAKQMLDRYGVRLHSEGATAICMRLIERWVRVGPDTYELVEQMAVTDHG